MYKIVIILSSLSGSFLLIFIIMTIGVFANREKDNFGFKCSNHCQIAAKYTFFGFDQSPSNALVGAAMHCNGGGVASRGSKDNPGMKSLPNCTDWEDIRAGNGEEHVFS